MVLKLAVIPKQLDERRCPMKPKVRLAADVIRVAMMAPVMGSTMVVNSII